MQYTFICRKVLVYYTIFGHNRPTCLYVFAYLRTNLDINGIRKNSPTVCVHQSPVAFFHFFVWPASLFCQHIFHGAGHMKITGWHITFPIYPIDEFPKKFLRNARWLWSCVVAKKHNSFSTVSPVVDPLSLFSVSWGFHCRQPNFSNFSFWHKFWIYNA